VSNKVEELENNNLFSKQYKLVWKEINQIRTFVCNTLIEKGLDKRDSDSIILIISELLENVFKYSEKKIVSITVCNDLKTDNIIQVKLDNPVNKKDIKHLKYLRKELARVNSYKDVQKLLVDTVKRSADFDKGKSSIGLALIRITSKGSKIILERSDIYKTGISILISYPLSRN